MPNPDQGSLSSRDTAAAAAPVSRFGALLEKLLTDTFGPAADTARGCPVVAYLHVKTRAADADVKARANYGNLYALAALCAHYLDVTGDGDDYEAAPARYRDLLAAMRARPHGARLQNHPLNHRLNEEYQRITGTPVGPIRRDIEQRHYWLNVTALTGADDGVDAADLARWVLAAVDAYAETRVRSTERWLAAAAGGGTRELLEQMLDDRSEARAFEIGSYAILAAHYAGQRVRLGTSPGADPAPTPLVLHRLGRTNANDGGIDFLLRPLGRVFQVTAAVTGEKVSSDLRKLGGVPTTFVVKVDADPVTLPDRMRELGLAEDELATVEEWVTRTTLLDLLRALPDEALTVAGATLERELRRDWL